MAEEEEKQPIIIKKIKKVSGGHHGGAWKVAYADFVTAMMALLIVLWIRSASEEAQEKIPVQLPRHQYHPNFSLKEIPRQPWRRILFTL